MIKIGLTGGVGSGKSTVAKILVAHGLALVDADAVSRSLTHAGGDAMPAIQSAFGQAVIAAHGGLSRDAMRGLILSDPSAKAKLEAILHPRIGAQIGQRLSDAGRAGAQAAVLDIPLLAEGGARWRSRCDSVWVVDCLPQTQRLRVQTRSGWPSEQIEAVIAAQASRIERFSTADAVIFNEGLSLTELEQEVLALLKYALPRTRR
jgi:dephospho-CoA kinase